MTEWVSSWGSMDLRHLSIYLVCDAQKVQRYVAWDSKSHCVTKDLTLQKPGQLFLKHVFEG